MTDLSVYLPKVKVLAKIVWKQYGHTISDFMEFGDLYHHGVIGLMKVAERYDPAQDVSFWSFAERRVRGTMEDLIFDTPHIPVTRKRITAPPPQFKPLDDQASVHQQPFDIGMQKLIESRLNPRDAEIVRLKFFKGIIQAELAKMFGLTQGRICQILAESISKLRGPPTVSKVYLRTDGTTYKLVRVSPEVFAEIARRGHFGDGVDSVLRRVLDIPAKRNKRPRLQAVK